jgi:hypothetical protein
MNGTELIARMQTVRTRKESLTLHREALNFIDEAIALANAGELSVAELRRADELAQVLTRLSRAMVRRLDTAN